MRRPGPALERALARALAAAAPLLLALACAPGAGREAPPAAHPATLPLFSDATAASGIAFTHDNAASGRRLLPETMGAGAAFFDADGDGLPDLYLVNGAPLGGDLRGAATGALYHNLGGGRFEDVTRGSGLAVPFFGMGAAVGDYDNDGRLDLLVTGLGGDHLFHNLGGGRFADVAADVGLSDHGFGSSAAFLDYDRDGWLDLFVGRYVEWSPESDVACSPDGVHRVYCTPEVYPGASNRLYHNEGGRRFTDVTRAAGLFLPEGKTLGVVVLDQDRDGWPDLAVANDTVRNFLFLNRGDGTFREDAVGAGMAYSESGATRGGMGIDAGDASGSGLSDVVVGNFAQEMNAFYRGLPNGFFVDDGAQVGIGLPSLMTTAFGTLMLDADGDGRLDLVFVNGHIEPDIAATRRLQTYAQAGLLFLNDGQGGFKAAPPERAGALAEPMVARGLAAADVDGDGDLDLVVTQNGRPARLLRNESPPGHWLRLAFSGRASNRTGYGAVVRAVAGARSWTRTLVSGRSYLSACEPVLTLALGGLARLDRLEVTWPSGGRQTVEDPPLDRLLTLEEPP